SLRRNRSILKVWSTKSNSSFAIKTESLAQAA
ncbi:MAG: hypothetical protein ACI8RE_001665, partial [Ilumatobacter sp.]